jgi:vacuolar protein sorting-associated protein 13A/C
VEVSRDSVSSSLVVNLSARERLDVNISTLFVELAMDLASTFSTQGEALLSQARGSYAPYRIKNYTGSSIYIWADTDGSSDMNELNSMLIENEKSVDWRFDDWKTMREVGTFPFL